MDLDSMKYGELRGLAKHLGLKANMKADRLLEAIKKHFDQQRSTEEDKVEETKADGTAEVKADESKEVVCMASDKSSQMQRDKDEAVGRQAVSTEQRTNLKFLVRLGKSPSEALGLLQQVYGDETMSRSRVFEWCKRFKEGREDVEDDPRSGRPSTSRTEANIERVRQMLRGDRRLTVRLIANELGMNRDNVWKIITEDLGMQKV
ncbi:protein GVQW3-like [Phycodurus eques]|uniref:protein GVQW3-like n=1 Tax=Phycodurus eques TaxID=693459 RepID=UPI002ACE23A1|nr:protein GVQW3-like [Phycodurus eques]